jgi:hypothetical protein
MALPPKVYQVCTHSRSRNHIVITKSRNTQFLVAIFASLGSLLYGYDLGVIAEAIASPNFNALFNPTKPQSKSL